MNFTFTNEQVVILKAILAGEMETTYKLMSEQNPHWEKYYEELDEIDNVLNHHGKNVDLLWGYLKLEDGSIIDLEGTDVTTITLSSPIKDYGREELGEEAGVLVERNYKRDKNLNTIKKVRKYFKKYMQ